MARRYKRDVISLATCRCLNYWRLFCEVEILELYIYFGGRWGDKIICRVMEKHSTTTASLKLKLLSIPMMIMEQVTNLQKLSMIE